MAGISLPAQATNLVTSRPDAELTWSKAPCRFCGTGCSVMVAVKDGQVVATHGDVKAEVNRGLNCVKGYFLSKIMYGKDRLTTPLLRKKDGQYHKDGEFTPVDWDEAFDVMEAQFKKALKEKGPTAVGMFGSGQWTVWEGYAAAKLMKAGFRSNNIDPNARHCMASAVVGFMRTFGMDEPMGCYDDMEQADAFVLWGSNMAEMHPILWTRLTDRRLSAEHVKVAVLSTFENRCFDLADLPIVFTPQTDLAILNYIANHIIQTGRVNEGLRRQARQLPPRQRRHRLWPETRASLLEQAAKNNDKAGGSEAEMSFDDYAAFVRSTRRLRLGDCRACQGEAGGAGRALRRSGHQGHVLLDHGLQPAHPRRLVQQPGLQHASPDRKDRGPGQLALLADRAALGLRHGPRGGHLRPSPAGRHGGDEEGAPGTAERSGSCPRARFPTSPAITRCCRTAC